MDAINILNSGLRLDLEYKQLNERWGGYQTPNNDEFYLFDKPHGVIYTFIAHYDRVNKKLSYTVLLPNNNTIKLGTDKEGIEQMDLFLKALL